VPDQDRLRIAVSDAQRRGQDQGQGKA
jgi:hypothetical protein